MIVRMNELKNKFKGHARLIFSPGFSFLLSFLFFVVMALVWVSPLDARGSGAPETGAVDHVDYSAMERKDIPDRFTWKTGHIYAGPGEWEKAKTDLAGMLEKAEKMSGDWTQSPQKMLALLELQNRIVLHSERLFYYTFFLFDTDMGNAEFQQMKGEAQSLYLRAATLFSFKENDILKLGKEAFDQYVAREPGLKPYVFPVQKIFRAGEHVLPTEQENIYSQSGLFSDAPQKIFEIINNIELPTPEIELPGGQKAVVNFANYSLYKEDRNRANRGHFMKEFFGVRKKFENTFAALLDAAMKQHLYNARVHRFKDCLGAALHKDNIDPAVYHNLIRTARENLAPLHRYFRLKKRMLNLDDLKYEDMYASAVDNVEKRFSFDGARRITLDMMGILGKKYTGLLNRAFKDGWIDIYPNKNKSALVYTADMYGIHPFVKLNYNGTYSEMASLVHELGHALHSQFSADSRHFATFQYPPFLAEIAATFNENILLDYLLKHEKDDLFKLYLLDSYLRQMRSAIYVQTLLAEFELAMHRRVEEGNSLTAGWLNKTYLELARFYYGHAKGGTEVEDYVEIEWSTIPHFYMNYYVYTYSTGIIASTALSEHLLKGDRATRKKYREKYLEFLGSGGGSYPLDALKAAGVDMTTAAPYRAAFNRFDQLVAEMEAIVERLKK